MNILHAEIHDPNPPLFWFGVVVGILILVGVVLGRKYMKRFEFLFVTILGMLFLFFSGVNHFFPKDIEVEAYVTLDGDGYIDARRYEIIEKKGKMYHVRVTNKFMD